MARNTHSRAEGQGDQIYRSEETDKGGLAQGVYIIYTPTEYSRRDSFVSNLAV